LKIVHLIFLEKNENDGIRYKFVNSILISLYPQCLIMVTLTNTEQKYKQKNPLGK
jgi:hypothetical protein